MHETADVNHASRWRWIILAFAVASVIINNFDRQMIAMLKPDILADFSTWTDLEYARLAVAFQFGAIASLLLAGWFLDRVGLRWGYAIGNGAWSAITLAHVAVTSFAGMFALRAALGASESIQTPAAVKSVATWFSPRQSSLALGIVNGAPNVGAIVVPLSIPLFASLVGWRDSFLIVGALGFAWLALWLLVRPPLPAIAHAVASREQSPEKWGDLLKNRAVWGFAIAKVLTDQVWWLMMFWLPDFFMRTFKLGIGAVAAPTAFVYLLAMLGALSGGALSSWLIGRGLPPARARMRVLVGYGAIALVAPLALFTDQLWTAALLVGLVLFAHQGFSTNLFAGVVDVFPARRVASVVAMGAFAGNLAGAGILELTGQLLTRGGTYLPLFVMAGIAYLLAAIVVRLLMFGRAAREG